MTWKVAFIPMHNKGAPSIAIILQPLHAYKVMLWIINEGLKPFLLPQISVEQTGFIPDKEISAQIFNLYI